MSQKTSRQPYRRGDQVFMTLVHQQTGEEKQRPGIVESDEIDGHDYIDVRFHDMPGFVQPVLIYYLFRAQEDEAYLNSLAEMVERFRNAKGMPDEDGEDDDFGHPDVGGYEAEENERDDFNDRYNLL